MNSNYKEYVDSLIEKYPNAEKAFNYFCEQSNYDNILEFLEDYGWNMEGLEEYLDNPDYRAGMDDLYYDTILRQRKKRGFATKMLGSNGGGGSGSSKPQEYTLTSMSDGAMTTNTFKSGDTMILDNVSKEGYNFLGWYTLSGEKITFPIIATKNITVQAKFEIKSSEWKIYNKAGSTKAVSYIKRVKGEDTLKILATSRDFRTAKLSTSTYTVTDKEQSLRNIYKTGVSNVTATFEDGTTLDITGFDSLNSDNNYDCEVAWLTKTYGEQASIKYAVNCKTDEGVQFVGWYNKGDTLNEEDLPRCERDPEKWQFVGYGTGTGRISFPKKITCGICTWEKYYELFALTKIVNGVSTVERYIRSTNVSLNGDGIENFDHWEDENGNTVTSVLMLADYTVTAVLKS